jgi:uncharacterized protein (DUF2062 family)
MTREFWQRKVFRPLLDLLKQGVTPEKIALSVSLGITLGVTPVLGSTSLLCAIAALALRLNLPAIQLVNYLVYPLQLALLIPFVRMGEWMFGAPPFPISLPEVLRMIRTDLWGAMGTLWTATLHALAAWVAVGAVASALMYLMLTPILRKMLRRTIV